MVECCWSMTPEESCCHCNYRHNWFHGHGLVFDSLMAWLRWNGRVAGLFLFVNYAAELWRQRGRKYTKFCRSSRWRTFAVACLSDNAWRSRWRVKAATQRCSRKRCRHEIDEVTAV
jgi:hypothetical protein